MGKMQREPKVYFEKQIVFRLPVELIEELDKSLLPYEKRSHFLRVAVAHEVKRRQNANN